jgi:hypothetical protein
MVRVTLDLGDAAAFDLREQGAHVGTIVCANGSNGWHDCFHMLVTLGVAA